MDIARIRGLYREGRFTFFFHAFRIAYRKRRKGA